MDDNNDNINNIYKKRIYYNEKSRNEIELEIELQEISSKYGWTPKVIDFVFTEDYCDIYMARVNEMCLAHKYSDDPIDIPFKYWTEIHRIVNVLYECEGIEYVDITPYNFIEYNDKIYIIDFGHAFYKNEKKDRNWFHKEFIEEETMYWNPDFQ